MTTSPDGWLLPLSYFVFAMLASATSKNTWKRASLEGDSDSSSPQVPKQAQLDFMTSAAAFACMGTLGSGPSRTFTAALPAAPTVLPPLQDGLVSAGTFVGHLYEGPVYDPESKTFFPESMDSLTDCTANSASRGGRVLKASLAADGIFCLQVVVNSSIWMTACISATAAFSDLAANDPNLSFAPAAALSMAARATLIYEATTSSAVSASTNPDETSIPVSAYEVDIVSQLGSDSKVDQTENNCKSSSFGYDPLAACQGHKDALNRYLERDHRHHAILWSFLCGNVLTLLSHQLTLVLLQVRRSRLSSNMVPCSSSFPQSRRRKRLQLQQHHFHLSQLGVQTEAAVATHACSLRVVCISGSTVAFGCQEERQTQPQR